MPWPEAGYQSDMSDIVRDVVPGPGRPLPGSAGILKLPDFLSAFATESGGGGGPSLGSGDMFVLPTFDPRPGKLLPESGDMVPVSVATMCLHTLTSAGSGPDSFRRRGIRPFPTTLRCDAFLPLHCCPHPPCTSGETA